MDEIDEDFEAALSLRDRYEGLWDVLHTDVRIERDKRYRVDRRLKAINQLGYVVDEVILEPGDDDSDELRLRVSVAGRDYHSRRLRQLTGIEAGEGQSAILLNDLTAWAGMGWAGSWDSKERSSGRVLTRADGARWMLEIFEPLVAQLVATLGEAHRPGAGLLRPPRGALAALGGGRSRRRQRGGAGARWPPRQAPSGSSAQMAAVEMPPRHAAWAGIAREGTQPHAAAHGTRARHRPPWRRCRG